MGNIFLVSQISTNFCQNKRMDSKQSMNGLNLLSNAKTKNIPQYLADKAGIEESIGSDTIQKGSRARKKYGSGFWGISIKTKERSKTVRERNMPFGIVIALKEMNGVNRIEDFMQLCMVRGWIVNRVEAKNSFDIYVRIDEDFELE